MNYWTCRPTKQTLSATQSVSKRKTTDVLLNYQYLVTKTSLHILSKLYS